MENLDLDLSLTVGRSGEDLALLGRDGGVAVDQAREDAAEGLNTKLFRINGVYIQVNWRPDTSFFQSDLTGNLHTKVMRYENRDTMPMCEQ